MQSPVLGFAKLINFLSQVNQIVILVHLKLSPIPPEVQIRLGYTEIGAPKVTAHEKCQEVSQVQQKTLNSQIVFSLVPRGHCLILLCRKGIRAMPEHLNF